MRKLILEEWISLDGFVTDKEGQLDFFTSLTPEQNNILITISCNFWRLLTRSYWVARPMNCLQIFGPVPQLIKK